MSIQSEITKLKARRASIVSAINNKGVTLDENATLARCATAIGDINVGETTIFNPEAMPATIVNIGGTNVSTNENIKIYADNGQSYTCQEWYALSGKGTTIKPIGFDMKAWNRHFIWYFKTKYRDTDSKKTYYDVSGSVSQTAGCLRHSQYWHPLITNTYSKTDLNGTLAKATQTGTDGLILSTTNSPFTWEMKRNCGGFDAFQVTSSSKIKDVFEALVAQTEWFRHRSAIDSGLTTTEADKTMGVVTIVTESDGEMYFYINGQKTNKLAKYNLHAMLDGDNPTQAIVDAIYNAQKSNGTNMNASCLNGDMKPVITEGSKGAEAYAYNGKWYIVTPIISRASTNLTCDYNIPDAPAVSYALYLRQLLGDNNITMGNEQTHQAYLTNRSTILNSMVTFLNSANGGSCGIPATVDTNTWSSVRVSGCSAWGVDVGSGVMNNYNTYNRYVGVGVSALS